MSIDFNDLDKETALARLNNPVKPQLKLIENIKINSFDSLNVNSLPTVSDSQLWCAQEIISSVFNDNLAITGNQFLWWDNSKFTPINESAVRRNVGNAMMNKPKLSNGCISGVTSIISDHCYRIDDTNPKSHNVYFKNGVFNPLKNEFKQHDINNLNTRTLSANYGSAECPQWIDWLNEIFEGEESRIDLLQDIMGWFLCRHDLGIQKAPIFTGPARAGKGTIVKVINKILESGSIPFTLANLDDDKQLSDMRTVNVAIDSDSVSPSAKNGRAVMGNFKRIAANEDIPIKLLWQQSPWKGPLNCKLLFLANSVPRLWDDSGATANRWIPLVFTKSYLGKEDPTLEARLLSESEGIANWALQGLKKLMDKGRFVLPDSSQSKLDSIHKGDNPIQSFIEDCLVIGNDKRCADTKLWKAYEYWVSMEGYEKMKRTDFKTAIQDSLQAHGVTWKKSLRINGKLHRGFEGIGFTGEPKTF